MRRAIPLTLLVTATLAARLPAQASTLDAAPPVAPPSATLAPELDRVLREYESAWRRGDAVALAGLFAEDGFVLQNGRPPVRGRAAIQTAYGPQAGGPLRLRAYAAAVADTVGYIVGAYGYGDTPGDQGKFTLTLRRARGGRWLIFSDMDNAIQPRRAAP